MTISLSPETQKLLEERIRHGGFKDADEALRDALQRPFEIEEDDRTSETQAAIRRGLADAQAGKTRPWSEFEKEWMARGPRQGS